MNEKHWLVQFGDSELGRMVGITLIICGFAVLCFVLMYGMSFLK